MGGDPDPAPWLVPVATGQAAGDVIGTDRLAGHPMYPLMSPDDDWSTVAITRQHIRAPLDVVFDVVADPHTYPQWLVGARDIRAVDPGWPAPGTQFHHRVGVAGPLTVADTTQSRRVERPTLLELEVRARPFGRGRVVFTLAQRADGVTEIVVDEVPIGSLRPLTPLFELPTALRNRRSLRRLAALIEREVVRAR